MRTTLDYCSGPKPKRQISLRTVLKWCALLLPVGLVLYAFVYGPLTSADIRLDTGDIRYRYFGIPLVYERMVEPARSTILSLSGGSTVLTPQWMPCESFPLSRWATPRERLYSVRYAAATAWAKVDPKAARLVLEEIAGELSGKTYPSLDSATMLSLLDRDATGTWTVDPDWRTNPDAVAWLAKRGLVIPATQSATLPATLPAEAAPL